MDMRHVSVSDYYTVMSVLNDWWGGRQMTHLLPRLFFEHFQNTSFILEQNEQLTAFLIGFVSQTDPNVAYIHFIGVDPEFRRSGLARQLYDTFFQKVRALGCDTVRCITSSVNTGSVSFHRRMGFSVSIAPDYGGPGQDYVLFQKNLLA